MKTHLLSVVAVIVLLVAPAGVAPAEEALAGESLKEAPRAIDPAEHRVGELMEVSHFTDLAGNPGSTADASKSKATVICMTGAGCPIAKKYLPTLAGLEKRYREKGVSFILVNPNAHEKPDELRAALKSAGYEGRAAHDPHADLARALGTTSSTEVFVLDAARTLQYRGAIDDQYGLGYSLPAPRRDYLVEAIDAVLEARQPITPATTAPGCALDLKPTAAASPTPALPVSASPAAVKEITYHNRISRIVQNNCQECHRTGEAGPFALTTYDEVKGHAAMIRKVVRKGIMPPWFADEKASKHQWANERSLSEGEKSDLLAWIEAGTPEGDAKDAPIARTFADGWRIGEPDAVFEAPYEFKVKATGTMSYQRVVVPTDLPEDKWVQAVEIRPSSPAVVHHVLVFLGYPPNHPLQGKQPQYNDGLTGYFAGLVPGQGHTTFPVGTAKLLPKGAIMIFQIHYTPNGAAVEDQPRIGMIFADKPPEQEFITHSAFNHRIRIPAGEPNHEVKAEHTFKKAVRLMSFMPHTHVRGKAFRYELLYPDGKSEVVLDVPRYDFNWQFEYQLRNPIDVPAGTRLKATAWYDNSAANLANPDPSKMVRWGDQTWEEMMIGYFAGYRLE